VRLVAIDAGGKRVRLLLPQLALDHLAVDQLDLGMALRAGLRDVPTRDGGGRIGVGEDRMGRVAGGAVGSDDQALLQKSFAMDALREVLEDVLLVNDPLALDDGTLLVALAAQERDLERRDRGPRILHRQDVVRPVAVHAARRERISTGDGLTMQRLRVLELYRVVAGAAIDRRDLRLVRSLLRIEADVALDARDLVVRGRF
jgi:hypothetical protein